MVDLPHRTSPPGLAFEQPLCSHPVVGHSLAVCHLETCMTIPSVLPPHGAEWPDLMADQVGMNWMWLEEAARFATENETPWPYDLQRHLESGYFEPPPFNEILGPIRPRGEPNGLV